MHANVIIFLDVPRYKCIWYVLKRAVIHWGKEIPGNPKDCKQRLFSIKFWHFLKWIWKFNQRYRRGILDTLDELKDTKKMYILKSIDEIDKMIIK